MRDKLIVKQMVHQVQTTHTEYRQNLACNLLLVTRNCLGEGYWETGQVDHANCVKCGKDA